MGLQAGSCFLPIAVRETDKTGMTAPKNSQDSQDACDYAGDRGITSATENSLSVDEIFRLFDWDYSERDILENYCNQLPLRLANDSPVERIKKDLHILKAAIEQVQERNQAETQYLIDFDFSKMKVFTPKNILYYNANR